MKVNENIRLIRVINSINNARNILAYMEGGIL